MKLTFRSPYLSIRDFPAVEIPNFTVITGLNGTGKTHLLKAVTEGAVAADCAPQIPSDVRFFDWSTLVPQDSGSFSSQTLSDERANLYQQFELMGRAHGSQVIEVARQHGIPNSHLVDLSHVLGLTLEDFTEILGDSTRAANALQAIAEAGRNASVGLLGDQRIQGFRLIINKVSEIAGKPAIGLSRSDLSKLLPGWSQTSLFEQSFARLFVAYRDLALANSLRQLQRERGRTDVEPLSNEEFIRRHMIPPWQFANDSFKAAGLNFEIDSPAEFELAPYEPRLRKLSTGAEVKFAELSSGEKILMSFALCLYYAQDRRQITSYPKLLLLDEIDAPLHPSMSRTLVETITKTLVGKYGINVIAATHSPSTVAIAPEESLYAMYPDHPGLHKISKSQALNILTIGVPTLSISYDGRRQVLVESPNDARLYDAIYQIARSRFVSERSLEFISTGARSQVTGAHTNTGCDAVKRLVASLTEAGNNSVMGLIDWDNTQDGTSRVLVFAKGRRNGLENAVLDPLLIAALISRDARNNIADIGLDHTATYLSLLYYPPGRLQEIVDAVQSRVLGSNLTGVRVDVTYTGAFGLTVDEGYLRLDDHELERKILDSFPGLNGIAKGKSGQLMSHMVDTVMKEKPEFIPVEFSDAFKELLERPSHPES